MMRAHIVRVSENQAGKTFAFDKVYIFRIEHETLLPRIFPYSLVLPMTRALARELWKLSEKACLRNDGKIFPQLRNAERRVRREVGLHPPLTAVRDNPGEYIALVPLLFTRRKDKLARPRYISAILPSFRKAKNKEGQQVHYRDLMSQVLSPRAYLLIEARSFRPVCVACNHCWKMLNGECSLGDEACYGALAISQPGDFVAGMQAYQRLLNQKEEEK